LETPRSPPSSPGVLDINAEQER
jgi:hypothetical protein